MTLSQEALFLPPPPPFSDDPPLTIFEDLVAGGIAGSLSVVVGHPFDTYKVRLQTSSVNPNFAAYGGVSSLFRGMTAPLSTAAIVNAVCFATFAESSRLWDKCIPPNSLSSVQHDSNMDPVTPIIHVPWFKALICGGFTGAVLALVTCPMEHIKCRLQVQHGRGSADYIYRGSTDAIQSILKTYGLRGLYRGLLCTVCREIPAIGTFFSSYDLVKDYTDKKFLEWNMRGDTSMSSQHGSKLQATNLVASTLAGGIAGALSWVVVYPVDVIKSKIQTAPLDAPSSSLRMWTISQNMVAQHGWRSLFRGLGVTIIRAFPVNGTIFTVYELSLSYLRS